MTLGEKVRFLRLERGLTQQELADDRMTRNMLSRIENGLAMPSLQNLQYIADRLSISPAYFFDSGKEYLYYDLERDLPEIITLCKQEKFGACIRLAEKYRSLENPSLHSVLCNCYYFLGVSFFSEGDFPVAQKYFDLADEISGETGVPFVYRKRSAFYKLLIRSFTENLVLYPNDVTKYLSSTEDYPEFLVYRFMLSLLESDQIEKASVIYDSVRLKNNIYRTHFNARLALAMNNYDRAKELLLSIVEEGKCNSVPILYSVYEDLERVSKATDDYKTAYFCAKEKSKIHLNK